MKAVLPDGQIRTFPLGSALSGHRFDEIRLSGRDLDELLYYGEENPYNLFDYLRHLRTKFPPENTQ